MNSNSKSSIRKVFSNPTYLFFVIAITVLSGVAFAQYNSTTGTITSILAPTELSLHSNPTPTSVYLRWQDNSINEDMFKIERKLNTSATWSYLAQTSQVNINYFIDTTITPGSTYDYRVRACSITVGCSGYANLSGIFIPHTTTSDNSGSTDYTNSTTSNTSGTTTNITQTTPASPSELMLYTPLASSFTFIPVKWKDNSNNEEKFKIERKLSSSTTFSALAEVNANIIGYVDSSSIAKGVLYDYRVRACVSDLCSTHAQLLGVFIPLESNTTTSSSGSTTTTTSGTSGTTDSTSTTNTDTTTYTTSTTDTSTNTNQTTDSTLTTATTTNTNTNTNTSTSTATILPPLPPSEFMLYSPLTTSSTFIPLKWKDNSSNEEKFIVERKLSNSGTFSFLKDVSANTLGYKDNAIALGTRYDYRLKACIRDICSFPIYLAEVFIPVPIGTTAIITNTTTITNTPTATTTTTSTTSGTTNPDLILTSSSGETPVSPTPTLTPYSTLTSKEQDTPSEMDSTTPIISNDAISSGETEDGVLKIDSTNTTPGTPLPLVDTIVTTTLDIKEVTEVLSKTVEDDKKLSETETTDLLEKDTNNDGVSDYDSIYVYKLDPVTPSPTSVFEGKEIKADEKILLGFDPTKPELIKVTPQEPKDSVAEVVTAYTVKEVTLTEEKKIVLKGNALPNSFVTIYIYSTPIMVTVKTDSKGEWQYTLDKELENGDHTVYTASVNNSGNIVAKSSGYLFTKTAEAVTLNDISIADASAGASEPSFLEGINIYVLVLLFVGAIIAAIFLIGFVTKRNNPTQPN